MIHCIVAGTPFTLQVCKRTGGNILPLIPSMQASLFEKLWNDINPEPTGPQSSPLNPKPWNSTSKVFSKLTQQRVCSFSTASLCSTSPVHCTEKSPSHPLKALKSHMGLCAKAKRTRYMRGLNQHIGKSFKCRRHSEQNVTSRSK